jgi:hypothetical protein
LELSIRTRAATIKHGLVGLRISWPDALQVCLNNAVHGPIELLLGFDTAIVQPAIPRFPALAEEKAKSASSQPGELAENDATAVSKESS